MGYFLTKFRKDTLNLHKVAETTIFIDRYIDEGRDPQHENDEFKKRYDAEQSLTLIDHYRHLCQLLPIYELLESKLANSDFAPAFPTQPIHLMQLLKQVDKIKADIEFLQPLIKDPTQSQLLPSTQQYIEILKKLEVNKGEKANELLGHFLVRILGDLFGGQSIKSYIIKMFERQQIQRLQPEQGVNFCSFEKNTLITLVNWLNTLLQYDRPKNIIIVDEDPLASLSIPDYEKIVVAANLAFTKHIEMYTELEQTRPMAASLEKTIIAPPIPIKAIVELNNSDESNSDDDKPSIPLTIAKNVSSLFCPSLTKAAAVVGVAMLATGLIIINSSVNKPG